jgi:hypothetical protein
MNFFINKKSSEGGEGCRWMVKEELSIGWKVL